MMNPAEFESLLVEADRCAQEEEWQACFETLSGAAALDPTHPGVVNGQGTCLVQLGRPAEAIPYFEKVVALAPDSAEARNNLGVAYSLAGEPRQALAIYREATRLDDNNLQAWKNQAVILLQLGEYTEGVQILAAVLKHSPQDVEALFLLAHCYEEGEDFNSARDLYQKVLHLQPDHPYAGERLAGLPKPAVDLTRIARPEHAAKLAGLKSLKGLKKTEPAAPNGQSAAAAPAPADGSVIIYGPPDIATEVRFSPLILALTGKGRQVKASIRPDPADLKQFSTVVFSRPHGSPELLDAVERSLAAGRRVVLDLDQDFQNMPADYPGYEQFGPGNPAGLDALMRLLPKVDLLTVPSTVLAERYGQKARRVDVILPAWNPSNPMWDKPAPCRSTVNVGVVGLHVQPSDLNVLKDDLARVLREHANVLLVVGAELNLCNAFSKISDDRKLFIPAGKLDDYPFLLANFDILLVPMAKNAFNEARSDLPLLEAGARRIPWVASPVPSFKEWCVGGLFAEHSGDWYKAIRKLIVDGDLRNQSGGAGRDKAEERASKLITSWGL